MGGPTGAQIESYRRNGFLIVERFLDAAELKHIREHFMRVFAHEWETGLAPDEVNYVPGVTAPERARFELASPQCCRWVATSSAGRVRPDGSPSTATGR